MTERILIDALSDHMNAMHEEMYRLGHETPLVVVADPKLVRQLLAEASHRLAFASAPRDLPVDECLTLRTIAGNVEIGTPGFFAQRILGKTQDDLARTVMRVLRGER